MKTITNKGGLGPGEAISGGEQVDMDGICKDEAECVQLL